MVRLEHSPTRLNEIGIQAHNVSIILDSTIDTIWGGGVSIHVNNQHLRTFNNHTQINESPIIVDV